MIDIDLLEAIFLSSRQVMPRATRTVALYLVFRANKDYLVWHSIDSMSKSLDISRKTIVESIRILQKIGLIKVDVVNCGDKLPNNGISRRHRYIYKINSSWSAQNRCVELHKNTGELSTAEENSPLVSSHEPGSNYTGDGKLLHRALSTENNTESNTENNISARARDVIDLFEIKKEKGII